MSKILKIIVNLVVLFSIIVAAALLVPPFAGVDTVMNDNTGTETNLPIGSVAYGKSVNVKNLEKKDKIIYSEGSSSYIYEIQDMDSSAGIYQVKDVYSKSSETETLNLQKSCSEGYGCDSPDWICGDCSPEQGRAYCCGRGNCSFDYPLCSLNKLRRKDKDDEDEEEEDGKEEYEDSEEDDGEEEEEKLGFRNVAV